MIKQVEGKELSDCLAIIRKSFSTVAEDFGLTEENCPTHNTFLKLERLVSEFGSGDEMYFYYSGDVPCGFCQLKKINDEIYELKKLAVLPEFRHMGIGSELVRFAKDYVAKKGGQKITIGIINESIRLRDWYAEQGFVLTGTRHFDHLPFTVGFMETELLL